MVIGAIKSLAAEGYALDPKPNKVQKYELTAEAQQCMTNGSPEVRFFNHVNAEAGSTESDLMAVFNNNKAAFLNGKKNCMSKRWVGFTKEDGLYRRLVGEVADALVAQLQHVEASAGVVGCFDDLTAFGKQKKKGDHWKTLKKKENGGVKNNDYFFRRKGTQLSIYVCQSRG